MKTLLPNLIPLRCFALRAKASASPKHHALASLLLLPLLGVTAQADTILKADNSLSLDQTNSWVGGAVPGAFDTAQWDRTVTAANTTNDLGVSQTWFGLAILDPAGAVTINAGSTLTLGDYFNTYFTNYNVVEMTNATADLVLNCDVTLNAAGARQDWCVGSGRTLVVGGLVTAPSREYGLHKTGAGTLVMTNDSNTYSGVTDIRDGVLVCTSIKNTSTPCSLGAPTSANYGAIGLGIADTDGVSHEGTLRYVGPGDITGRFFRMYAPAAGGAIDASGSGPLVITNTGASVINGGGTTPSIVKTLTLKGDNTDTNTIGGTIGNHSSGMPTALAKEGVGKWVLTAANLYAGGTTVRGGTLEVGPAGSIKGHVSVANGAVLQLDNPTALPATNILTLDGTPSVATIILNYSPTQTISALYFGATQKAAGTWGAPGSTAANQHTAFTGAGILQVTSGPVAGTTTTTLVSSQNPSEPGSNVTFTATVSSAAGTPSGDVVFKANTVPFSTNALAGGVASAETAMLPVGTNTVTAEYAAQATWLGSSGSLDQVVKSSVVYSQTNVLLSVQDLGAGSYKLSFQGTEGARYYVVTSADVAAPMNAWTVVGTTNTAGSGGLWDVTVSGAGRAFYRGAAVDPLP